MIDRSTPEYWIVRTLFAVPGAYVAWRSYRAYRRRRANPAEARDDATDRWWRVGLRAAAVLAASLLLVPFVPSGLIKSAVFGVVAIATAVVFVVAFMIGLRGP